MSDGEVVENDTAELARCATHDAGCDEDGEEKVFTIGDIPSKSTDTAKVSDGVGV